MPEDWIWDHAIKAPYAKAQGCKSWQCKYCLKKFNGGPIRVKAHLGGVSRQQIGLCDAKVPSEVRKLARDYFVKNNLIPGEDEVVAAVSRTGHEGSHVTPDAISGAVSLDTITGATSEASTPATSVGASASKKRVRNSSIEEGFSAERSRQLNSAVARFFYQQRIPFNVIRSDHFRNMMRAQAVAGLPGHAGLLGYNKLRTSQLADEVKSVDLKLLEFRKHWAEYGCTIVTDGWTDAKNRQIINFMVSSVYGTVFLRAVDAGAERKTGLWLWQQLRPVLMEVGLENVVQVVTDNAKNCISMGAHLRQEFKFIIHGRCVCHSLDLLLEDIVKLEWAKEIEESSRTIVNFITRSPMILAMFRSFCKGRELIKPGKTRFAYIFLLVSQLTEEDIFYGLRQMFSSDSWRSSKHCNTPEAKRVETILFETGFQREATELLVVIGPILKVLRLADREGATSGLVYEAVERMHQALEELLKQQIVPDERVVQVLGLLRSGATSRWDLLHNSMQGAAFALNPLFLDRKLDREALKCWQEYMKLYCRGDLQLQFKFDEQFNMFRNEEGCSMGSELAKSPEKRKFPVSWWRSVGYEMEELQTLAVRILSQVVSASPSERNWSAWSLIQVRNRNRISPGSLKKLVHVYTNTRLFERVQKQGLKLLEVDIEKLDLEPQWQRVIAAQQRLEEARRELGYSEEESQDAEEEEPMEADEEDLE